MDRLTPDFLTHSSVLKIPFRVFSSKYPVGRKITDEEFANVNLKRNNFHGEWNYTILPSR